jgi:hypothetical protein
MPLANDLRAIDAAGTPDRFPLVVVRCTECSLVQITETVAPEILFRDYAYFSSFSDSFVDHAARFAERMVRERELKTNDLVVEVASNDGYLLKHFADRKVRVLGVEPARNVAEAARRVGVPTIDEFFNEALAHTVVAEHGHASLAVANNVLAHVADLHGVVAGLAAVVGEVGTVVVETPYLLEMIDRREFDTIYHEHLCYYSLTALVRLFDEHGLTVVEIEQLPVHGGSLRLFAKTHGASAASVNETLAHEESWGIRSDERYDRFAADVEGIRQELTRILSEVRRDGRRVAGYGAAAKAAIMLNVCGLDINDIDYVVDRNPVKQGRLMPGTSIPIVAPEVLASDPPDFLMIFVWNIYGEVAEQQVGYVAAGGRFIVPIPFPRII